MLQKVVRNPLMERTTQDGDHAMGGKEVEDNHDLEHVAYSRSNINDQEHAMEEVEEANE